MMLVLQTITGLLLVVTAFLYWRERSRNQRLQRDTDASHEVQSKELTDLQKRVRVYAKDPVTGLLGWQVFEDRASQAIKECARYKFIMGVMYVDIDNFKLINEALGHEAANQLLCEVAERLETCIRQVDSISRQGKDTFVVLLTQLAKQETAVIIVQRMFQALSEPFVVNGQQLTVTMCAGLSFYPADGVTTIDLMQHAEYAMLMAKAGGKNTYQFHQQRLQAESQRELRLYNSLSSGAFLDELSLQYQSIINVSSQEILCSETQIVWQHPVAGNISEQELFSYAEQQGKLKEITKWVLRNAGNKFQQWHALGLKPQMLGVPVMLKQLENASFIYSISQILQENELAPQSVMLEIMHCNAPVSLDVLEKSFNMLKYLGIKIAIVDFGSGSFPLRYLNAFYVDYLKLEKTVVDAVVDSEQARLLVKALVEFAAIMSMQVIASGVEEESQAKILNELGVNLLQGKLLGEPLSEPEMVAKMADE